jgi:hypothetical protein
MTLGVETRRGMELLVKIDSGTQQLTIRYQAFFLAGPHRPRCCIKFGAWIYPVRNNPPLGFESQRLEFLTGFTQPLPREGWLSNQCCHLDQSKSDLWKLSSKG